MHISEGYQGFHWCSPRYRPAQLAKRIFPHTATLTYYYPLPPTDYPISIQSFLLFLFSKLFGYICAILQKPPSTNQRSGGGSWLSRQSNKLALARFTEGPEFKPRLDQHLQAWWRSGYRARLEILFLRERQFESGPRRMFLGFLFLFQGDEGVKNICCLLVEGGDVVRVCGSMKVVLC